ncbi:homeobox protein MSH-D [Anopheles ziemanni]|uniref:homeobox protein MSH-D n=1 Tax=Anopheles coustani TaxID=139045 RepID=UPI002659D689|nr:homeobox protein MSH-D [Anopheles coustani]XP_058173924.1 homeobox protein MSH-D [Anopheles ziemanni]
MAASSCKSVAPLRQSDFSIEHILTRAGERFERRRRSEEEQCRSCYTSSPGSEANSDLEVEDAERSRSVARIELDDGLDVGHPAKHATVERRFVPTGSGCGAPAFDWLYYTRYHPPKLPRPAKAGPVKRTPGRLPRVPFTPAQLSALEDAYKVSTYLSSEEANQLAYSLDLTNTRVKIWFQNRRARDRREKREAQLIGAGADPLGPIPLYTGGNSTGVPIASRLRSHPSSPSSTEGGGSRQSRSPTTDRNY